MALIQEELKIVSIKELLFDSNKNLTLPPYQRPYSWSVKSANTLFTDIYEAFKNQVKEYRIGSVILHKEDDQKSEDVEDVYRYNIVDGQQRLTTLSILLCCLLPSDCETNQMLDAKYCMFSQKIIAENYSVLYRRVQDLNKNESKEYLKYILENCTVVQIVTNNLQEAFQFFDSQNSRGKELAPHDLLKSYHLREMSGEKQDAKTIIEHWEDENRSQELDDLFKNYLYPLTRWYRCKSGLNYSVHQIDSFKGIKKAIGNDDIVKNGIYNHSIYHTASNIFIEKHNEVYGQPLNQFQLTQPLIAGKRFYSYKRHYKGLLEKEIQKRILEFSKSESIPIRVPGDIYIKQLYENSLLFFADRFDLDCLSASVMLILYSWVYSLRLVMHSVYLQTINKYAVGKHERINEGLDMFAKMYEMKCPEELKAIALEDPNTKNNKFFKNNKKNYSEIYIKLCKWNGWKNEE